MTMDLQRTNDEYSRKKIEEAADFIKSKISIIPKIGIICGSGLSRIGDEVQDKKTISYMEIPTFPHSSVAGHNSELVCGKLGGKNVICFRGRFHLYEGFAGWQVALPVRVMKLLGVEKVLITNAAGGMNENYSRGDFMLLNDHISFPGMVGSTPLCGPNDDSFGPRFVSMHDAYDKPMRDLMIECAKQMNLGDSFHEGIYCMVGGPCYNSPAELRMLKLIGADTVGMSTVPEVMVARHCGMKVIACSLVTDMAILKIDSNATLSHEEVLRTSDQRSATMTSLVVKFVEKLPV